MGPTYQFQCCLATRAPSPTFVSDGPIFTVHVTIPAGTNNEAVQIANNLSPASSILAPDQPPLQAAATLISVLTIAPATAEATIVYPAFTQQASLQPTIRNYNATPSPPNDR